MEVFGKYISILGAGESGVGAALLAKKNKIECFVSDAGPISEAYKKELEDANIPFEENGHSREKILNSGYIVKSPGVPGDVPICLEARSQNILVGSEIEFASYFTKANVVGITGTNGKTTTTKLIYDILKHAGYDVGLAGNIGISWARALAERDHEYWVLEISSFQLDDVRNLHCHIATLLNITEDHLDRYDYKMENYIKSKFKITNNQNDQDHFVYKVEDENIKTFMQEDLESQKHPLSTSGKISETGAWSDEESIYVQTNNSLFTMRHEEITIKGKHNQYNSMAAAVAAKILGIKNEVIKESLENFVNAEHRMEPVARVMDVHFLNDSKATNVNATWYALDSMTTDVIWIAGGVDKGNEYEALKPLVRKKVKALVCLGKDTKKLEEAFENDTPFIVNAFNMKEAVDLARHMAKPGYTVLLSPACASFDLFKNYQDRGDQFKKAVKSL